MAEDPAALATAFRGIGACGSLGIWSILRRLQERIRLGRDVPGLLADCAVDRLAEEVGVAGVACCLLDEVQEHPAQ
jgi:hypothetical protein